MGVYNDFGSGTKREGWSYTYKGSELLDLAKVKLTEYQRRETAARKKIAELYQDKSVSAASDDIDKLKREIDNLGKLHEQCHVFVHEFARTPEREFHLSLGDVTFFDLHKKTAVETGKTGWNPEQFGA